MKFLDFFAGIGGFRRGLELAGHTCVGFCEFDKFATASYTAMHLITEEQKNELKILPLKKRQKEILKEEYRNGEWYANDIRTVDARSLPKADCWCFGAPCQDFSVAGKRAGLDGNRSSLIREIFRLLEEQEEKGRPEWLIYENVKGMLSSNRGLDYLSIISEMDKFGYDIEWQNINSKWFVPQNRERIYTIGHLRRYGSRKILPVTGTNGENSICLIGCKEGRNSQRDRIYDYTGISPTVSTCPGGNTEPKVAVPCFVDMSYNTGIRMTKEARTLQARYDKGICNRRGEMSGIAIPVLTPDRAEKRQNGRRFKEDGEPMFTLTSQDRHGVAIDIEPLGVLRNVRTDYGKQIRKDYENGNISISRHDFTANEIRNDGISNTLSTVTGDNQLAVKVSEATKQGYTECKVGADSINFTVPNRKTRRERVGHEIANTLDTGCNQGIFVKVSEELAIYAIWYEKYQCYITIRKLTPKECFRLQGWTDEYFEKAAFVNLDSQLYKQAGNGVTVNVVYEIGKKIRRTHEEI